MRAGGYTIQHTLTPEAATVVKQALGLARRRGHAQVTPLHVASAMLTSPASPTSLLRKACLQPGSHPLQCKALELCFNVALNRLPTVQSSPIMLNPNQPHHPSLSNALVAAFKRAQAHQRRGSIENQQQPILALKVEIEQLIISILDDPSVSRVMREAGFSSTQVKNNIEQMEISVPSPNPLNFSQSKENIKPKALAKVQDEDVMSVIEMMMSNKRKNIVVIRECLASADAIVRGVIGKFEAENNINLRFMQFVSLPLDSLNHLSREDVENKVRELKCLVRSFVGRGVILYLGDLKSVSDYWSRHSERKLNQYYYTPVEHMIMEISGLMFGVDIGKIWLMGIANSETYMRCKTGHPSLESVWNLCPLTLPVASLDLTLNLESNKDSLMEMKLLTCCEECSLNATREARSITGYGRTGTSESITTTHGSTLPSWLQQYKEENSRQTNDQVGNLCKKWNSICSSLHKQQNMSSSPNLHQHHLTWPAILESNIPKEHQFFIGGECFEDPNPKTFMPELLSNPNSSPNSASCSEASADQDYNIQGDHDEYYLHKFKEMNSENVKILSNALERVAPWQREIIPEIVTTILQCRSGTMERTGKEETWLCFLGADNHGKEKIARELAKVVFGSRNDFVQMGLSRFSVTPANSTDDDQEFASNKRTRDENGQSYLERFIEAVQENPNRVFLMEDVEQVDYRSQMGIKKAIKDGRITLDDGQTVLFDEAIVIFSSENFSSISRASSPSIIRRKCSETEGRETAEDCGKETVVSLDLNIATQDHKSSQEQEMVSDTGILDLVDKQVIFKLQML